jgi:hypothetical protein
MKHKVLAGLLLVALFLALAPIALASTRWYVNGMSGSDSNACTSATTACKTISHAISLSASGDSIMVAAATYTENLTVGMSLKIFGSGAATTIIDGGGVSTVVTISNSGAHVVLSKVTIRNGAASSTANRQWLGGGVYNKGTLTVSNSTLSGNRARCGVRYCGAGGGGIYNGGTLTINNTTISGNVASSCSMFCGASGGGISNGGTLTINNSTISGNVAGEVNNNSGGGIYSGGTLTINNTTVSGNRAVYGGGIAASSPVTISSSTISGNAAAKIAGGIANNGSATLQNTILAGNFAGNCNATMISNGYNLSSDGTCNLSGPGDLNNTDPQLGPLQNNGGPTQTIALPSGSPAVDAGNPNGCTDGHGHLLKTDQRGNPRPDPEDTGGCDMGAYESQSD